MIKSCQSIKETRCIKKLWIAWETHRRSIEISKSLGVPLVIQPDCEGRILRYLRNSVNTVRIVMSEQPDVVFVQNPSLVLSLLLLSIRSIWRFTLIQDLHNAGIWPFEGRYWILNRLALILQRRADLNIVTNSHLERVVKKNGGKAFVLPDKIPTLPASEKRLKLHGRYNVLFVCTFSSDEPYREVLDTAKLLPDDYWIYVSGDYRRVGLSDGEVAPNVALTGHVPEDEYVQLLCSVDAVMGLTRRDNCLLCAAYEGLAAQKPLILSDTEILKKTFKTAALYADNTAEGIKTKIMITSQWNSRLLSEVEKIKTELSKEWQRSKSQLWKEISQVMTRSV